MMTAPLPDNEAKRLDALRQFDILDTPPERNYDNLVQLASQICGAPMAMVSLIDTNRQWFKAKVGLATTETDRGIAFCAHAILQQDLFVVSDATTDKRFADNPLVTNAPHIRFYAGMPLIASDGHALGTLCVADRVPRELTKEQGEALRVLGREVVTELELRQMRKDLTQTATESKAAVEALRASEEFKTRMIEGSRDCIKVLDLDGRLLSMNAGGMEILEICDLGPVLNTSWIEFWQGEDREKARAAVEAARSGRVGRFVGYFPTTVTRKPMWWDVVVNAIKDVQGRPEKLLALSRDVTELKQAEETLRTITAETASATASDFFHLLVRHLAVKLQVRYAFVAECTDATKTHVRTLAFWNRDSFSENVAFPLRGTPCEPVIGGQVCCYPERVQSLFPLDTELVTMAAEGYLGVPLHDSSGNILGHIALIDDKPWHPMPHEIAIVKIFAARAGAELERVRAYEDVHRLNQELGALRDINRAIGRHLNRDELFGALAWCLKTLVPTERFGIELPIEGDKLQGHILTPSRGGMESTQPTVLPASGTACDWVMQNREWFVAASRDELREHFPVTFDVMSRDGMESLCAMPLVSGGHSRGALFFMAAAKGAYAHLRRELLDQVASAVAVALDDCLAHEEVRRLRDRLAAENVYLQEEIKTEHDFGEIIGVSPAIKKVFKAVERVASTDSTVLVTGETGTGKELIARAIHNLSRRKDRVLVKVNCAAIPAGLIESELFGHEKGAFTGALSRKIGRFELADGATIFLDEVGDLPVELQAKLLRVLQEGEFERLGNPRTMKVDVRVIAATNRDLGKAVHTGGFRSDLYYRLNVFPIELPPLRERREDIRLLVDYFVQKHAARIGKKIETIPQKSLDALQAYSWPGNVRELENVIERAVILSHGSQLELSEWMLKSADAPRSSGPQSLEELERSHILTVLHFTNWRVSGEKGAANLLGLKPTTLEARMKKLGITRPSFSHPNIS